MQSIVFLNTYIEPATVLIELEILSNLMLITTLEDSYPHFADKETELQRTVI